MKYWEDLYMHVEFKYLWSRQTIKTTVDKQSFLVSFDIYNQNLNQESNLKLKCRTRMLINLSMVLRLVVLFNAYL